MKAKPKIKWKEIYLSHVDYSLANERKRIVEKAFLNEKTIEYSLEALAFFISLFLLLDEDCEIT